MRKRKKDKEEKNRCLSVFCLILGMGMVIMGDKVG